MARLNSQFSWHVPLRGYSISKPVNTVIRGLRHAAPSDCSALTPYLGNTHARTRTRPRPHPLAHRETNKHAHTHKQSRPQAHGRAHTHTQRHEFCQKGMYLLRCCAAGNKRMDVKVSEGRPFWPSLSAAPCQANMRRVCDKLAAKGLRLGHICSMSHVGRRNPEVRLMAILLV